MLFKDVHPSKAPDAIPLIVNPELQESLMKNSLQMINFQFFSHHH